MENWSALELCEIVIPVALMGNNTKGTEALPVGKQSDTALNCVMIGEVVFKETIFPLHMIIVSWLILAPLVESSESV